jgi:5S rRNA maturation endonuclease (ribonuclease M5)
MSAFTVTLQALEQVTGHPPKRNGNGWIGHCPAHDDHTPSLSVDEGENSKVLLHCHAGCSYESIVAALNITPDPAPQGQRHIVATYSYCDEAGVEVRQKVRYEPKDFHIRHRDEAGQWVYKAGTGPAVLYRLPEVKAAIAEGRTVFVCEGEKDCDRLAALGLVPTTNIEGAAKPDQKAKWRPEYTEQLTGAARVVLLPDNDDPGRAHMRHVAKLLAGKARRVVTLNLPGRPDKGDVSDWINAGHTIDELKALATAALAEPEQEQEPNPGNDLDGEFIPIGQFIASPPDSSYLVKYVLPASGLGQVFGCSHVGKSFVLIDLACHLALGWDWHGYKVKKTTVLYIAAEGVAGLKLRFRAWFQEHNVAPPDNLRIRVIPADLTAEGTTHAIADRIARLPEKPGLVIIDTFATNFGPGSENDAEDMGAAMTGLRALMGDGLILSAHHTGHGDKTRSRGHSSLFCALDVELHVTQDADKRIQVGHTKLRDGDKLETIAAFELKKVSLPWADVDGDPLNSAVLVPTEAEQSGTFTKNEQLSGAQRIAVDALKTALIKEGIEEAGVVTVAEDQWRKACYSAGISAGENGSRAQRLAFQRARTDLVAAGKVSTQDGRYWIPIGGTKRNKAEQCSAMYRMNAVDEAEQSGTYPFRDVPHVPSTASGTADPGAEQKEEKTTAPIPPAADSSSQQLSPSVDANEEEF